MKKNVFLLGLLWLLTALPSQAQLKTVVIDAGHGGKDPGSKGKIVKEKDIALKIALKTGELIQKNFPDVTVVYTREDDVFIELEERSAIANRVHADLFISIHCNASDSKAAYGTETYIMGMHKNNDNLEVAMRENSVILQEDNYQERYQKFNPQNMISYIRMANYQSAYQVQSADFARRVEDQFKERVRRTSRGVKQSGFLVLWQTSMPSVLIEVGFISNPTEEQYLRSALGQDYIASGIYRAFKEYKQSLEALAAD
ncbi:MAG: N-acetylmuramoyl-L-alanine amidase [Bernardetiaceae bacterium]